MIFENRLNSDSSVPVWQNNVKMNSVLDYIQDQFWWKSIDSREKSKFLEGKLISYFSESEGLYVFLGKYPLESELVVDIKEFLSLDSSNHSTAAPRLVDQKVSERLRENQDFEKSKVEIIIKCKDPIVDYSTQPTPTMHTLDNLAEDKFMLCNEKDNTNNEGRQFMVLDIHDDMQYTENAPRSLPNVVSYHPTSSAEAD